ncbi:MAG TPA: EthD family reductase [Acetobacteraceae bacterium]|nr:EthD family reductase [Acetobacteraceae bacterium]
MIVVSVMYPATPDAKFDLKYYLDRHVPMVGERWNAMGLREAKILQGVGAPGGAAATYSVTALLTFGSVAELEQALAAHGQEIMADIANFTNVQPIIQVNDVLA